MKLNVYFIAANRIVHVNKENDAAPANGVLIGSFDHAVLDDPLGPAANHVIFHHVQELLYHRSAQNPAQTAKFPENITDMASIKIQLDLAVTPVFTTLPSIAGAATVGTQLTATPGVWTPTGGTVAYAWESSESTEGPWTPVAGATQATYTLVEDDLASLIRVSVAVTMDGESVTKKSTSVGPVAGE